MVNNSAVFIVLSLLCTLASKGYGQIERLNRRVYRSGSGNGGRSFSQSRNSGNLGSNEFDDGGHRMRRFDESRSFRSPDYYELNNGNQGSNGFGNEGPSFRSSEYLDSGGEYDNGGHSSLSQSRSYENPDSDDEYDNGGGLGSTLLGLGTLPRFGSPSFGGQRQGPPRDLESRTIDCDGLEGRFAGWADLFPGCDGVMGLSTLSKTGPDLLGMIQSRK